MSIKKFCFCPPSPIAFVNIHFIKKNFFLIQLHFPHQLELQSKAIYKNGWKQLLELSPYQKQKKID